MVRKSTIHTSVSDNWICDQIEEGDLNLDLRAPSLNIYNNKTPLI